VFADRVVLMHDGAILAQGTPQEILTDTDLLRRAGLTPPMAVRAYYDLAEAGIWLPFCPLTDEGLVDALCQ
jgi:energy-coupling factor transport system ATP-binding protein